MCVLTLLLEHPDFLPKEAQIFKRICHLLSLDVEIVFVFENRASGRTAADGSRVILKDVFKHSGIPYVNANGDAKALCCQLQQSGFVDAVWSQDMSCLEFGCTFTLRDYYPPVEKSKSKNKSKSKRDPNSFRIVRSVVLLDEPECIHTGLVFFARTSASGYDALKTAQSGIGVTLCRADEGKDWDDRGNKQLVAHLEKARLNIKSEARMTTKQVMVPEHIPRISTLQRYQSRAGSKDIVYAEQQGNVQATKLFKLTSKYFQIFAREFLNLVGPMMLARYLARLPDSNKYQSREVTRKTIHNIELVQRRKTATSPAQTRDVARKITFSPFRLTSLSPSDVETDTKFFWTKDPDDDYDVSHRVQCELPIRLLKKIFSPKKLNPLDDQTNAKRPQNASGSETEEDEGIQPVSKKTCRINGSFGRGAFNRGSFNADDLRQTSLDSFVKKESVTKTGDGPVLGDDLIKENPKEETSAVNTKVDSSKPDNAIPPPAMELALRTSQPSSSNYEDSIYDEIFQEV